MEVMDVSSVCDKCNNAITSHDNCLRCYQCDVELHKACAEWQDTADGRVTVCHKCRTNIELPVEYSPDEASNSQAPTKSEVKYGLDRELTCVLFPGLVKNPEKAIQCLGGIKGISLVQNQPQKKRLGLSFHPENPFVKKVFSDYKKTAGVLLKVKVKKVNVDGKVEKKVISTDVLGRVSNIHRFDSMCDFQYLPVYREASGEPLQCLLDKIIPDGEDNINFMTGESPLYIVPAHFTRFDKPINYSYTDKKYPGRSGSPEGEDEFHNKLRSDRGRPLGHWWRFRLTGDFPEKPDDYYVNIRDTRYDYNPAMKKEFEVIKKDYVSREITGQGGKTLNLRLSNGVNPNAVNWTICKEGREAFAQQWDNLCFEDRPIWSLNRLKYETKFRLGSLKILVPCVAVFMKDGPWKSLWVRFGFDPRKEPSARMYQTLDFRLRHQAGVYSMVMTREQVVHYKSADRVRHTAVSAPPPHEDVSEGAVFYRPGMVPAQRQIFYQLCDVKLPEVESIIAAEPAAECHEKLGWLPPLAAESCRDHIFKSVKETLLASHNAHLKFDVGDEGSSSDEDSQGSGDDITNEMDDTL